MPETITGSSPPTEVLQTPVEQLPLVNATERLIPNNQSQLLEIARPKERIGGESFVDMRNLHPLHEKKLGFNVGGIPGDLMAVLKVGDSTVGIVDTAREHGYEDNFFMDPKRFLLTNMKEVKDKDGLLRFETATLENGAPAAQYIHEPDTDLVLGRNRQSMAFNDIGIDGSKDPTLSGQHVRFKINEQGMLHVQDLKSLNGTCIGVRPAAAEHGPQNNEFMLGDTAYRYAGKIHLSFNKDGYGFETRDKSGKARKFFVYRSNSEGSLRVSQGVEKFNGRERFLKGSEGVNFQYTQDTQLFPEFEDRLNALMRRENDTPAKYTEDDYKVTAAHADELMSDFGNESQVYALGDAELFETLHTLHAGDLKSEIVASKLSLKPGSTPEKIQQALMGNVEKINKLLQKQQLVPDFNHPVMTETSVHPVLGNVTRETFRKEVNGRQHEWTMSSDTKGRVWIERIRLGDTTASAYGTDKELLYSGILTSKPIDYKEQVTAIPESMRAPSGHRSYDDITDFLDLFAPIQAYRQARGIYKAR